MKNVEIAKIFSEIGEYLDMQEVAFKPRAYEKVAETITGLQEELADIYKKDGLKALEKIPGVGISIAEKIEELIKTGHLKYYRQLKKEMPVDLAELTAVEGLGPRHIKVLYKELGIKNIRQLEKAAKAGNISKLAGFGSRSEEKILKGIHFFKKSGGRFLLGSVVIQAREIEERLKRIKGVKQVAVGGSLRRKKETVGDIDILVSAGKAAAKKVSDLFVSMPEVETIHASGPTKSLVRLKSGIDADLRVIPESAYGAALNYFTGSKEHNITLRELAMKKGYKLSEYGLFKGKKQIAGKTEEGVYNALGLDYIEPEMRERTGEIEAARKRKLPKLIGYTDLKGDLQIQTDWSDGANSIEEMAREAARMGLEYILITDHTKRLAMTNGLDEKRILKQIKEIDRVNAKLKKDKVKIIVLKGSECDILKNGEMDLKDNILARLDVVGGAIHSYFNLSKKEQTERIKKAMSNSNVDIIFHPTGRLINKREAYDLDMDAIIEHAKKTKTVLEINAFPDRLDLKDEYVRKCVAAGVLMSISSDSHATAHLSVLEYGIAQARRGWAVKKDIINAWPLKKMLSYLK